MRSTPDRAERADEGEQVEALVQLLHQARERGEDVDPYQVVYEHPEIAERLEKRFHEAGLFDLPPRPPAGPRDLPAQFGRYLVHTWLGEGAAGVVYQATDRLLRREVALKVFHGAGAQAGERFERDARVAASLTHRNIVTIHDVGRYGGCCYFVMALASGGTLAALLERERRGERGLEPRRAAELVRKVALALDYAHRAGVVHRDVKPANILIDQAGEPLLADFGLARRAGAEATLTVSGEILGTLAYLSPEQAAGHAHEAGPRSDVYSLGVVLYECLTGRRPFCTESLPALLALVASAAPPAPRRLDPSLPRDLERICLAALEKHPEDRLSSAAEVAEQLRRWLAREPVLVPPVPRLTRLARWVERRPRQAGLLGLAAGGLVALAVLVGWMVLDARGRASQAEMRQAAEARARATVEVHALLDLARQRLRVPTQGRRLEAQRLLRQARRRRQDVDGPAGQRLDLELRSAFFSTLGVPDLRPRESTRLPGHFAAVWRVALHPDGKTMAVGTPGGPRCWQAGQRFTDTAGLDGNGPRPWLTFTPDGSALVFASPAGGLELWDGQAVARRGSWGKGCGNVLAVGFLAGGTNLRACREDGTVHALALPGLQAGRSWRLPGGTARLTAAAFGPGGELAVGDEAGNVQLFDAAGQRRPGGPRKGWSAVSSIAWSGDGGLLAVGRQDGTVLLWDVVDDGPRHHLSGFATEVVSLLFHPRRPWLAAGDRGTVLRTWDVMSGAQVLSGEGSIPWGFSRDGRVLATTTTTSLAFLDLLLPDNVLRLHGHRTFVGRIAWARSSRRLASLDGAFEVRVWDVGRSKPLARLRGPIGSFGASNAALALSDDGTRLAYASGGELAKALLLDVGAEPASGAPRQKGPWSLPAGFERLACLGRDRFLLVREEREQRRGDREGANAWPVRSVVYELGESGPRLLRTIRHAEPGDVRRFLDSSLSVDGRFYAWSGPRLPEAARRVEVRDVATGALVWRLSAPAPRDNASLPGAKLSPDGKHLWACRAGARYRRYGLPDDQVGELDDPPDAWLAGRWRLDHKTRADGGTELLLYSWGEGEAWLRLENDNGSTLEAPALSPDGRFLAWADDSGSLTVADLAGLKEAVGAFEQESLDE